MKKYFYFLLSIICAFTLVFICFIKELPNNFMSNVIRFMLVFVGITYNFLYYYFKDTEEQEVKQEKYCKEIEDLETKYYDTIKNVQFVEDTFYVYYRKKFKNTNYYMVANPTDYIVHYDKLVKNFQNNNIYYKGAYLLTALAQSQLHFLVYKCDSDYDDYKMSREYSMHFYSLTCLVFVGFKCQDVFPNSSYCSYLIGYLNNYISKGELGTAKQINDLAKKIEDLHKNYKI